LSIADAGSMTYQKSTLSVLPILRDAIENSRPLAAKTDIALLLDVEATIDDRCIGDGQRLRQLFDNLLANSVRYTDSPGRAIVSVVNRGEVIVVEIRDSAPAVSTEHLPKLFDRLYRVDGSRNRSTGGAGLGLSICKKIVEAHGGQIEALISDLGGLTIRVHLPGLST
jgi:two-component system sensor histidine kinase BaeS